jgi:hypothetical protein
MTYGRFTQEQWDERKGNPYLLENGKWYKLTDWHIVQGQGIVTYQAEECDPREVERWLGEHTYQPPFKPEPESTPVEPEPTPWLDAEPDDDPGAAAVAWELDKDIDEDRIIMDSGGLQPEPAPSSDRPSLQEWAKDRGWVGTGRISNRLKAQYAAIYGPIEE